MLGTTDLFDAANDSSTEDESEWWDSGELIDGDTVELRLTSSIFSSISSSLIRGRLRKFGGKWFKLVNGLKEWLLWCICAICNCWIDDVALWLLLLRPLVVFDMFEVGLCLFRWWLLLLLLLLLLPLLMLMLLVVVVVLLLLNRFWLGVGNWNDARFKLAFCCCSCSKQWILNQLDRRPYLEPLLDMPTFKHLFKRQALQDVRFFLFIIHLPLFLQSFIVVRLLYDRPKNDYKNFFYILHVIILIYFRKVSIFWISFIFRRKNSNLTSLSPLILLRPKK